MLSYAGRPISGLHGGEEVMNDQLLESSLGTNNATHPVASLI
jgi:hypothetical protein